MVASFALLMLAAFGSGIVNAVAGGGAFLSFPALVFAGIPPVDANASSTVALFPGQATTAWAYRRDVGGIREITIVPLIVLSVVGGALGALLLVFTSNAVFVTLVPWLLLLATTVFAIGNFAPPRATTRFQLGKSGVLVAQFIIAIYGGYFGGGIGFLMLAALTLYGMRDIHAMNGLKILLATLMNGAAVVAFIIAGLVRWPETLAMALASVGGGYVGAVAAKRIDQRLLKSFIVLLGVALTIYFFYRG